MMNGYNQQYNNQNNDGQYAYSSGNGWYYYEGAWHQNPQQAPVIPTVPKKTGGRKALAATSLVMACALAGFGGTFAANAINGSGQNSPAVVYKAPESTNAQAGPVTAGDFSVSEIAASAGQSVVSITTENTIMDYAMGGQVVSGAGSGVIISQDGYIITNHHVLDGAQKVTVTLPDGSEHPATVVGADEFTDVGVLKINVTGLKPATMGNSDQLQVGEFVIAIGNPMGTLGGTVTDGIISALNREINIGNQSMHLLQMSAAVSPGNSGGGLFNAKGELIGVVNAKSGGEGAEGLGFAIPVNTAIKVADQIIDHGYVTGRPALGVSVVTVTTQQEALELGVNEFGVFITQITPGSAAEKAGLQVGDKIVSADGQEVQASQDLSSTIREKEVGDSLELQISRNGQIIDVTAVLGEMSKSA